LKKRAIRKADRSRSKILRKLWQALLAPQKSASKFLKLLREQKEGYRE